MIVPLASGSADVRQSASVQHFVRDCILNLTPLMGGRIAAIDDDLDGTSDFDFRGEFHCETFHKEM